MKKLNLVSLFVFGLLFSSYSFAATVPWNSGTTGELDFGATTTTGNDVALSDSAAAVDFNLASGATVEYYFTTLQEVSMSISTTASGLALKFTTSLIQILPSNTLFGPQSAGNGIDAATLSIDTLEYLGIGSYLYTITNNSLDVMNVSLTAAIASTPIPAALLLFGSAFIGLFGVKSYSRKKMAA